MVGRRRRGDDRCVDSDEEWPWRVGGRVGYGRGLPSLSLSLSISFFPVCLRICSTCSYLGGGELEFANISIECGTGKTMEEQSHRNVMKQ